MAGRLADYLDVPLRYPLHCAASASAVLEAPPPAGTYQCAARKFWDHRSRRVHELPVWRAGAQSVVWSLPLALEGASSSPCCTWVHAGCHVTAPRPSQSLRSLSVVCSWPSGRAALVAGTDQRFAPPVRRVGAWGSTAMGDAVVPPSPAWPLYYDGDRRTRFAYAIFALNKVGLRMSGLTTKTM